MGLFISCLMALSINIWDTRPTQKNPPEQESLIAQMEVSEHYINSYGKGLGISLETIKDDLQRIIQENLGDRFSRNVRVEVHR